jgi:hypothetical protein
MAGLLAGAVGLADDHAVLPGHRRRRHGRGV